MAESKVDAGLTPEQVKQFNEDGFLVIPNYWSKETCESLREEAKNLVDGFDGENVTVFTTEEQTRVSDAYFLGSGDKIRFFFEEGAINSKGEVVKEKHLSINKIGHAMHDLDPVFRDVTYTKGHAAILKSLGFKYPLAVQSMYIFKQPGIGGKVGAHQDGTFLYTKPQSVVGMWYALEDCSKTNGCLWAVPGSHKDGVKRRFHRNEKGGTSFDPPEEVNFDLRGAKPLEVGAGTLVLLHSACVHYSEANQSDKSRHAFTLHVIEGAPPYEYPSDNWLQSESGKFNTFPGFSREVSAPSNPDGESNTQ